MKSGASFDQALDAFRRGDLDRARAIAEDALDHSPSPKLQHLMGLIECRSGKIDSGIEWLREASEAEPANAAYRVMLVRALIDGHEVLKVIIVPRRLVNVVIR